MPATPHASRRAPATAPTPTSSAASSGGGCAPPAKGLPCGAPSPTRLIAPSAEYRCRSCSSSSGSCCRRRRLCCPGRGKLLPRQQWRRRKCCLWRVCRRCSFCCYCCCCYCNCCYCCCCCSRPSAPAAMPQGPKGWPCCECRGGEGIPPHGATIAILALPPQCTRWWGWGGAGGSIFPTPPSSHPRQGCTTTAAARGSAPLRCGEKVHALLPGGATFPLLRRAACQLRSLSRPLQQRCLLGSLK